jgi:hypothetical protein
MLSHGFNGNNAGKKRYKPSYRLKIRWETFGLPASEPTKPSIEAIRSEVSSLAATRLAREPVAKPGPSSKPSRRKRT